MCSDWQQVYQCATFNLYILTDDFPQGLALKTRLGLLVNSQTLGRSDFGSKISVGQVSVQKPW